MGHAHANGWDLVKLIASLSDKIVCYHLHDNDGTTDSHSAVGDGTIDFSAVMAAVRRNDVRPVIEVGTFDGVMQSIVALDGL